MNGVYVFCVYGWLYPGTLRVSHESWESWEFYPTLELNFVSAVQHQTPGFEDAL